jgi:ribonuclease HII
MASAAGERECEGRECHGILRSIARASIVPGVARDAVMSVVDIAVSRGTRESGWTSMTVYRDSADKFP